MTTAKQQQQQTKRRRSKQKFDLMERMMGDQAVSSSAFRVAVALLHKFHNNLTDRCNPGTPEIARVSGLSTRTVFTAIAELKAAGWIIIQSVGGGSKTCTNRYKFDWTRKTGNIDVKTEEPIAEHTANTEQPETRHAKSAPLTENGVGMQELSPGMQTSAYEPLRTTPPPGGGVRESKISVALRAPGGALATEEDLATGFKELCQIWIRPYGTNKAKAKATYLTTCAHHGGEILAAHGVDIADLLLVSARNWTAKKTARWLPKLEDWLANEAWRNEPSPDKATRTNANDDAVEEMLRQGGVI
jgi:helix-turn-helix protein